MYLLLGKEHFVNVIRSYFNPFIKIKNMISLLSNDNISNLVKLSNSLETIESNSYGDVYIEFKSNVIIKANQSIVVSAKDELVSCYKRGSFSPNFDVMELINIKDLNNSIIRLQKKIPIIENITRLNINKWSDKSPKE